MRFCLFLFNRRVARIEERLDGLLATLANNETTTGEVIEQVPDLPTFSSLPTLGETNFGLEESHEAALSLNYFDNSNMAGPFLHSLFPMMGGFSDIISRDIVCLSHAEACVQYFQEQSATFPFVIAPQEWSLEFLRVQRPVLLLAIICMATRSNKGLQRQVEAELRETLSKRIIVKCEKSLDIIQAILVYLAWYRRKSGEEGCNTIS